MGANIGGLKVARGLVSNGRDVTVLEEAPGLRTTGAAISIWCNGTDSPAITQGNAHAVAAVLL